MTRDLFGFDDAKGTVPKGMTALALHLHRETDKAWLLSDTGKASDAVWLAKSLAERGEGRDEDIWTVPSWKARELGWL